jgi:two-component system sensor histidine kinase ChvG
MQLTDPQPEIPNVDHQPNTWWLFRSAQEGKRSQFSPIVLRILAVNVMALAILVGSLLYLGRYQDRIVATELDSLLLQSRIIASAVAEGAVVIDDEDRNVLSPLLARLMVRRLAETTDIRTRLFDVDDTLLADSRMLLGSGNGKIQIERLLSARESGTWTERVVSGLFDTLDLIHERQEYPKYNEQSIQRGSDYGVVRDALKGENATQVWRISEGGLILAAAVPVQHYKQVLGAVMMTRSDANIDKAITTVRVDILKIFAITLLITILLSLYLARAIARPIRLLAMAAEGLRAGQQRIVGLAGTAKLLNPDAIPDMTSRKDEIGDLSGALRALTAALAQRIGAIENFAADVAHEIKNPLTSLRSAVETAERVTDPVARNKLMGVIRDDVDRLDRLISDISNASRLDAELSRDETLPIDVGRTLFVLEDLYKHDTRGPLTQAAVVLRPPREKLRVVGVENRLVQVLKNLIDNGLSFSSMGGVVAISAIRDGKYVLIFVEDDGPGVPENKLDAIFDRFYSERPASEKFGMHSGLGLSISKQIVEAHRGTIWAENRRNADGKVIGARFVVQLPVENAPPALQDKRPVTQITSQIR